MSSMRLLQPIRPSGPLAAVDMGSNSFRLEIARVHADGYRRIDYLKETVRLGAGINQEQILSEEAIQRGLNCLARFATRLSGFSSMQVRAVATQTLREARNRNVFLERAQAVFGYPIEVISGREEARLIFSGVARLQPSKAKRLVIDIGGRSTEMILGQGFTPYTVDSFSVGSASLSMRYFADGRLTASAFRRAQIAAGAELEEALVPFAASHWQEALGSSGTVGALSQLLQTQGITDGTITPKALQWVIDQCLIAGHIDKLKFAGLKEDRKAVLAGGVCVLYTLTSQFGIEQLLPARGALRQGVIFDLNERLIHSCWPHDGHDVREVSVRELQQRFHLAIPQARRVMEQAMMLYDQLTDSSQNASAVNARRELQWAAGVHEIGMMISHHDYHRHGAYVMNHIDAPGFSQSQQRHLALLLLAQRGSLRKVETEITTQETMQQIICLRLAVIMCHARHDVPAQAWRITFDGYVIKLEFSHRWAKQHPRTLFLLQEEVGIWDRTQIIKLLLCPSVHKS